jgi:hypothetical protein
MNRDFSEDAQWVGRTAAAAVSDRTICRAPSSAQRKLEPRVISFLLRTGDLQTKALNHRRYSRGRATTSGLLAMCWY